MVYSDWPLPGSYRSQPHMALSERYCVCFRQNLPQRPGNIESVGRWQMAGPQTLGRFIKWPAWSAVVWGNLFLWTLSHLRVGKLRSKRFKSMPLIVTIPLLSSSAGRGPRLYFQLQYEVWRIPFWSLCVPCLSRREVLIISACFGRFSGIQGVMNSVWEGL